MNYLLFLVGLLLAGFGGEIFLKGIVGFSRWTRLAPAIVGTTVAAFATSAPELSVGINASLQGAGEVTLGDALGSNIVNISLILGLILVSARAPFRMKDLEQNLPFGMLAPVLTLLLASDSSLSRFDGILLLFTFGFWVVGILRDGAREAPSLPQEEAQRVKTVAYLLIGVAVLAAAGSMIVTGATGIGRTLGLAEYVIGTTIVAIGTSIPELATSLVATLRGYHDVSLQTILGSNIFNGLFIVGIAAIISPIHLSITQTVTGLSFGLLSLLFVLPAEGTHIGVKRGMMLLLLYSGYVALLTV